MADRIFSDGQRLVDLGGGEYARKVVIVGSTGTPVMIAFENPMADAGDLIVGDEGGSPIRLGAGSDGQVLMIDPDTHVPAWSAAFPDAPVEVTGARDDPEGALASLLSALATLGLITDSTTET